MIVEDGMEFRHRKAENIAEKKTAEKIKEKLEVLRFSSSWKINVTNSGLEKQA